jgi:uncharacterized protein
MLRLIGMIDEAAKLFDEGRFFEAHEEWEKHWLGEKDETRKRLLQGLIQIAAGFHKLLAMSSPESAERLLAKGLAKLDAFPQEVKRLELEEFRAGVHACARDLAAGRFDRATIPRLTQ